MQKILTFYFNIIMCIMRVEAVTTRYFFYADFNIL